MATNARWWEQYEVQCNIVEWTHLEIIVPKMVGVMESFRIVQQDMRKLTKEENVLYDHILAEIEPNAAPIRKLIDIVDRRQTIVRDGFEMLVEEMHRDTQSHYQTQEAFLVRLWKAQETFAAWDGHTAKANSLYKAIFGT